MRPNEFKELNKQKKRLSVTGSELAASMASTMGVLLRSHGVEQYKSDQIALEVMSEMRRVYGGTQIYFSREENFEKKAIYEEMFARHDRKEMSAVELAMEYGFSLAWTYTILKAIRAQKREERDAQAKDTLKRSQNRCKRES
ncbi:Mor transcription activator family protein [compost metagenome]